MTFTQTKPQTHTQDPHEQIKMLSELLAKTCASVQAAERENAHWAQRCTFLEEEIEELISDPEEWLCHRRAWLSAHGIEC